MSDVIESVDELELEEGDDVDASELETPDAYLELADELDGLEVEELAE